MVIKVFLVDFINVVADNNKSKVTAAVEIANSKLWKEKGMPVSISSY